MRAFFVNTLISTCWWHTIKSIHIFFFNINAKVHSKLIIVLSHISQSTNVCFLYLLILLSWWFTIRLMRRLTIIFTCCAFTSLFVLFSQFFPMSINDSIWKYSIGYHSIHFNLLYELLPLFVLLFLLFLKLYFSFDFSISLLSFLCKLFITVFFKSLGRYFIIFSILSILFIVVSALEEFINVVFPLFISYSNLSKEFFLLFFLNSSLCILISLWREPSFIRIVGISWSGIYFLKFLFLVKRLIIYF